MTLATLLMVAFLVTWQILGALGLTNKGLREDAVKKIAKELYALMQKDKMTAREALLLSARGLSEADEAPYGKDAIGQ